jgi:glutathione S-transferase
MTIVLNIALLPEADRSPRAVEVARRDVAALLSFLHRSLAGQEYIALGRFTVADVNVASVVNIAPLLGVLGSKTTNVTQYLDRMKARPAYQRAAKG